jgi:alpha-glucosidase (family GH31 glycosyl hydrolase)
MPLDNQHLGGDGVAPGSHLRFHNMYGMQMVRASRQGLLLANPQKRPFILSRSNFLGGHRYAATWTGDNLSSVGQMQLSIPTSLTLGLSGQPFSGPDIGGFCENATAELVAQWTAQGVYFPFVRNHNIKGTRDQEPWAFDEPTLNTCRTAIERRYLLMPYIYTAARQAYDTGISICRPLYYEWPEENEAYRREGEYMFGDDILVSPIVTAAEQNDKTFHKTWLPEGQWFDVCQNKLVNGYQTITAWYAQNEIPYFYRVKYDVFNATYDNKGFYQFKVNTFIKRDLSKNIREGKVDTAWIT